MSTFKCNSNRSHLWLWRNTLDYRHLPYHLDPESQEWPKQKPHCPGGQSPLEKPGLSSPWQRKSVMHNREIETDHYLKDRWLYKIHVYQKLEKNSRVHEIWLLCTVKHYGYSKHTYNALTPTAKWFSFLIVLNHIIRPNKLIKSFSGQNF